MRCHLWHTIRPCRDSPRSPAPTTTRRSCCACTSACSVTATRWPSRAPPPARPATGGRCSPTRPTCSSTPAGASPSTPAPTARSAPELRELGQTRAGWLVGSQFVFSQHCKSCRALGFSEEKIEALKAWQRVRPLQPGRAGAARLHRRARAWPTAAWPTACSTPCGEHLERRGDPGVHLHHDDVHDARGDLAWRCASSSTTATTRSSRSRRPREYAGRQPRRQISAARRRRVSSRRSAHGRPRPRARQLHRRAVRRPAARRLRRRRDQGRGARRRRPDAPLGRDAATATACGGRRSPATSGRSCSTCGRTRARRARARPGRRTCDVVLENFRPGVLDEWGLGLRRARGGQPAARARARQRLRPDRTAGRTGRVRQRRRGDGRHPLHHRQPRPAAVAGRHQPRRRARLGVRRDRHARRAVSARARRASARRSTSRSTKRSPR